MANSPTEKRVAERCWTLVGRRQGRFWYARRRRPETGQPTSVMFDASWVLDREESKRDVIGFYHTHPSGKASPSKRDDRTMRAWVSSFGKPMLCLIEADREVVAYRYDDDEGNPVELTACELFPRGIVVVYDNGESENGQ